MINQTPIALGKIVSMIDHVFNHDPIIGFAGRDSSGEHVNPSRSGGCGIDRCRIVHKLYNTARNVYGIAFGSDTAIWKHYAHYAAISVILR